LFEFHHRALVTKQVGAQQQNHKSGGQPGDDGFE